MTTIKLKNGSGAPTAGDLAQGEPALDLTNKRLYTEDSGGTVIEVGTNPGVDVTFADNRKAVFGTGSDLEIYHDGSHSYVKDSGTGHLKLQGTDVRIQSADGSENFLVADLDGAVRIYNDNTQRLQTTSTGIDVTGTVTADGLTVQGASNSTALIEATSGNDASLFLTEAGTGNVGAQFVYDGGDNELYLKVGNNTDTNRLSVSRDTGDISFYEDTGTTAKLFWDASAESLGIGTSSPAYKLDIYGSSTTNIDLLHLLNSNNTLGCSSGIMFENYSGGGLNQGRIKYLNAGSNNSNSFVFEQEINATNGLVETMRIDSSGNVGIGTNSPAAPLSIAGSSTGEYDALILRNSNSAASGQSTAIVFEASAGTSGDEASSVAKISGLRTGSGSKGDLLFHTTLAGSSSEAMRIDSSGNVKIGDATTDVTSKLTVSGNASASLATFMYDGAAGTYFDIDCNAAGGSVNLKADARTGAYPPLLFTTGGSESMRIDSDGNLLVGRTSRLTSQVKSISSDTVMSVHGTLTSHQTNAGILQFNSSSGIFALRSYGSTAGTGQISFQTGGGGGSTDTEAMRIDSSGNVGIGTTSPDADLHISGTGNDAKIILEGTSNPRGNFIAVEGADDLVFAADEDNLGASSAMKFRIDASECMRIDSSGHVIAPNGITLGTSVGTYAAANTLDDYEEGTWTPVIADASSGGNASSTTANGTYVKIGRVVYVQFNASNINTSGMTSSNDLHITGLPFTSKSSSGGVKYTGTVHMSVVTFEQMPVLNVNENQTHIKIQEVRSAAGVDAITVSQLSSGASDLHGNLVYETA